MIAGTRAGQRFVGRQRPWERVLGADGAPLAGVFVFLEEEGKGQRILTTDAEGKATAGIEPPLTADVDAVHAIAVARRVEIVYPLTTEPWGVRRFFVRDPNGVVVNVVSHADPGGTR